MVSFTLRCDWFGNQRHTLSQMFKPQKAWRRKSANIDCVVFEKKPLLIHVFFRWYSLRWAGRCNARWRWHKLGERSRTRRWKEGTSSPCNSTQDIYWVTHEVRIFYPIGEGGTFILIIIIFVVTIIIALLAEKISGNQRSLFSPLKILSNKHSSHKSYNHGIFTVGIPLKYWSTLADTKTKSAVIESRGLLLYYVISVLISNPFSRQTRNTRTALETREDNLVEFATCESPFPVLQGECS